LNERRDLIHVDLVVAHQALDRLTDNLLKDMGQAYRNEALTSYCAQMRGELCAYFNGSSLLLDDYHDGIELTR
jgi:ATP/maltotriose-dependent transcriptional regulator MalT